MIKMEFNYVLSFIRNLKYGSKDEKQVYKIICKALQEYYTNEVYKND